MKSKFLYIIIGILIISNVYFLFNINNKSKGEKNEEFKNKGANLYGSAKEVLENS